MALEHTYNNYLLSLFKSPSFLCLINCKSYLLHCIHKHHEHYALINCVSLGCHFDTWLLLE